jgi:hypothetical protein
VEIKIGVQDSPREVVVESTESLDSVVAAIEAALKGDTLALTDSKGRRVFVPGGKIAYVEIGNAAVGQVGFRG